MAFKRADSNTKKNYKGIGTLWESDKYKGLYLRVDPECDLVLYDRKSGKYYKVLKFLAKTPNENAPQNAVFNFYVNLDNDKHVEYQGSDED